MALRKWFKNKVFRMVLTIVLSLTVTACGTILYPGRIGQDRGRIDPAVAVMDGLCVLIVVVPGLIAYIVDFATGAIYLPGGDGFLGQNEAEDFSLKKIVDIGPPTGQPVDLKGINTAVEHHTGRPVDLTREGVRMEILEGPRALATAKRTLQGMTLQ